ncbi:MAG: 16S rRNA (guanine(966)-N(2))-methyltransferase RsmD [Bifidobacterium psychraerophilum]
MKPFLPGRCWISSEATNPSWPPPECSARPFVRLRRHADDAAGALRPDASDNGNMRIVSGRFKGFQLTTPRTGTRPTTDRAKEGIFSHLESYGEIEDARVLDLYAGTGALGIEALSRGAHELVAVESSARAAALIASSLKTLKRHPAWMPSDSARVVRNPVERFLRSEAQSSDAQTWEDARRPGFDVVFMDPPYALGDDDVREVISSLIQGGLIRDDGVLVVERSTRSPEPLVPEGWGLRQVKQYGETAVYYVEGDLDEQSDALGA